MHFIEELSTQLSDKVVLMRVDFNVPVIEGKISDYTRIHRCLNSIQHLIKRNAKVVLITHFGRPNAQINPALSLSFLLPELSNLLQKDVKFSCNAIGHDTKEMIARMKNGDVLLLENIRFYAEEETNNDKFAKDLASLGDIYINEAFSCSHRNHASVAGIVKYLPSYAGFLFKNEIDSLSAINNNNYKPSVAIIGGKKISTKIDLVTNLSTKVDSLVIAGAMANTFLKARGHNIGSSFYEPELVEKARDILLNIDCNLILPVDFICNRDKKSNAENINTISDIDDIQDIGPITCFRICQAINDAKIVLWNGPVGIFEKDQFALGTNNIARFIGSKTMSSEIISVAGGGDTISALHKVDMLKHFTYVSTAGGAFLEFLEGKELPGVAALRGLR